MLGVEGRCRQGDPARIVVVLSPGMDEVAKAVAKLEPRAAIAIQDPPMGTGHAVMQCRPQIAGWNGPVVVVTGDSPMLRSVRGSIVQAGALAANQRAGEVPR